VAALSPRPPNELQVMEGMPHGIMQMNDDVELFNAKRLTAALIS
jgi:hypothetical protein